MLKDFTLSSKILYIKKKNLLAIFSDTVQASASLSGNQSLPIQPSSLPSLHSILLFVYYKTLLPSPPCPALQASFLSRLQAGGAGGRAVQDRTLVLLGEKLIGLFLDQVEDHSLFAPLDTCSGPNIWLGLAHGW